MPVKKPDEQPVAERYYFFPHTGNQPNDEKRDVAKMLYVDKGLSLRDVATRMGVTYQAVHSLLKRAGVDLRGRGGNQGAHSRRRK